jgi:hypothetical protein
MEFDTVTFGGIEYACGGNITEFVYSKRRGIVNAAAKQIDCNLNSLFEQLYFFLPKDRKFCSCLLYENLIVELIRDMQPNLDDVLQFSKCTNCYGVLNELNKQIVGWPTLRSDSIGANKIRPEYWEIIGLKSPSIKCPFHLIEARPINMEFIEELLDEEDKFKDAIFEFEVRLGELIGKVND